MKARGIARKEQARRIISLIVLAVASTGLFCLLSASTAEAAPKADLWPRWQEHDPSSSKRIDHSVWDKFLERYLVAPHPSGINRVRYGEVTPKDRKTLQGYLNDLQSLPISTYNRKEQKAYWINLYNALTVEVVLSHYPVTSIRDINISPGWFTRGPWGAKLATVEGGKLSLDDIEHRILRPIWKDNRVHYAVNCASLGCPNLQPVAYTTENLDSLLHRGAREYVNHLRGASFKNGSLRVSSIYIWFQEDFGGTMGGVLAHLLRYAEGGWAENLKSYDGPLSHDYDWKLNAPESAVGP